MGNDAIRIEWLTTLRQRLPVFLASLQIENQPGRYLPCRDGAILSGERAALGFSCFAKKILDALGLWESLPHSEQSAWLEFIRAFQHPDGAFVDPALLAGIQQPSLTLRARLHNHLHGLTPVDPQHDAILAETKQAIATLASSNWTPRFPFGDFPTNESALLNRLQRYDWRAPWGAGAKSAALALFIQTQAPGLSGVDAPALRLTLSHFLAGKADRTTGGYFLPPTPPARGQLINGAMKVLNALEWLDEPIHYPQQLIDTCLLQGPPPAGCHVVDWIFVLHRALRHTDHRRLEIQSRLGEVIDRIRAHQCTDNGFSYQPGKAQSGYYGATISRGLHEGDLHGTCLLTWALAMSIEILEWDLPGWQSFRA
ncbi:MAG: hypothetical protein H7834_08960 [Magnetococcus sp. YQC-9]